MYLGSSLAPIVVLERQSNILRGILLAWLLGVTFALSVATNDTIPMSGNVTSDSLNDGNISDSSETIGNKTDGTRKRFNRQIPINSYSPSSYSIPNVLPIGGAMPGLLPTVSGTVPTQGANINCPPGSIFRDGQCLQQVRYCAAGYNMVGNTCVGQSTCQQGYNLVNGQCHLQAPCATQVCGMPPVIVQPQPLPPPPPPPPPMITTCTCESGYTQVGNQCMKQESIPSEVRTQESNHVERLTCPAGYELNYDECVQHHTQEARCERGIRRDNLCVVTAECRYPYVSDMYGRCVKNMTTAVQCPPEARLVGSECLYEKPECPTGYRQEANMCFQREQIPISCEGGEPPQGGLCVVGNPTCPPEFRLTSGGQCMQERRTRPICPPGLRLDNDVCVMQELNCPPGFTDRGGGVCLNHERKPATCPSGARLVGDVCEYEREICPRDYKLEYMQCVRYRQQPAVCPNGLQLQGGECILASISCETGYTLKNGACVRELIGRKTCPVGSTLREDKCVMGTPKCDYGFLLRDGVCVQQSRQEPRCAAGAQLRNGKCVLRVNDCPSGAIRNGECVQGNQQRPTCDAGFSYVRGRCLAEPQCEYGFTYRKDESMCISVTKTAMSCPSGTVLEDGQCVSHDMICTDGYTLQNGQCVMSMTTTPICPPGTSLDGNRCQTTIAAQCRAGSTAVAGGCEVVELAYPTCPAGYSYYGGQCHGTLTTAAAPAPAPAPSPCMYGTCANPCTTGICGVPCATGCATQTIQPVIQTIQTTQPATCPAGYTMQGSACTRRAITQLDCPLGYTMNAGQCVSYHAMVCAEGSTLQGDRCVQMKVRQATCRDGHQQQGNRCVHMRLDCPPGYRSEGGNCVTVTEKAATCPNGSIKKQGYCVSTPICPSGYYLHQDMCQREDHTAINCPSGFVLAESECIAQPSCAVGYRLEGNMCVRTEQRALSCPSSARLVQDYCVVGSPICEQGYDNIGDRCVKSDYRQPICPPNSRFRDSVCVFLRPPHCEHGYTYSAGQCTKLDRQPINCPNEFQITGDRCVSNRLICPMGYQKNGNECVLEIRRTILCPYGSTLRGNLCIGNGPNCEPNYRMTRGECIGVTYSAPECPPDTVITDGRCVRSATCAFGYQLRGTQCVKQQVIKLTCARGFSHNGNCVALGPSCPPEHEMRREGCVRRETQEPNCPAGASLQNNYCVIGRPQCTGEYRYENGRCIKVAKIRAQCRGNAELRNGMCVTKMTTSSTYCQPGSSSTSYPSVASGSTTMGATIQSLPLYPSVVSLDTGSSTASDVDIKYSEGHKYTSRFDDYMTDDVTIDNYIGTIGSYDGAIGGYDGTIGGYDGAIGGYDEDNGNYDVYSSNTNQSSDTNSYSGPSSNVHDEEYKVTAETATEVTREKRCTVMGPRICANVDESSWTCKHNTYASIASSYCKSESTVIQLVVDHHRSYNDTFIVMAPTDTAEESYDENEEEDYGDGTFDVEWNNSISSSESTESCSSSEPCSDGAGVITQPLGTITLDDTLAAVQFGKLVHILGQLLHTLLQPDMAPIDDVDAVRFRICHVLVHEAPESRQIRGDARYTHHCTFGRCVSPWFVVGWKHTKMATAYEFFIVQPKQWVGRVEELGMEHDFHTIVLGVEEMTSTDRIQHWIIPVIHHVVRRNRWIAIPLQCIQTTLDLNDILFGQYLGTFGQLTLQTGLVHPLSNVLLYAVDRIPQLFRDRMTTQ
uniref:Uncharacterized protein n=1 Tax=Anopheles culicifacies TaxID=139723 RepID=A0A182M2J6_9DIPT